MPFAVVGSNTVVESQGRKVRGRMYPWGIVEVENLEHNDFIALRNMLIRSVLLDIHCTRENSCFVSAEIYMLACRVSKGTVLGTVCPRGPFLKHS